VTHVRFWIAVSVGVLLFSVAAVFSQSTEPPRSEEYLLLGNPNRGAGTKGPSTPCGATTDRVTLVRGTDVFPSTLTASLGVSNETCEMRHR
jgi:hypothetical protein